ncbi:MAG: hypothetical protein EXQ56_11935 [Acidobacteria bacterium]|nr:hypothetical protein [Acidobacteriota bacterium]
MSKAGNPKRSVSQRRKSKRIIQGFLAVIVIAGIASAWFLGGSGGTVDSAASPKSGTGAIDPETLPVSLRNRLVLPAKPLDKRPYTLEPSSFNEPEVRASYQAARDVPEVLEHIPCYCGCFANSGHRNNLDCFKDNHGVSCALCRTIAVESKAMSQAGLPVEQISLAINEKYAPRVR